MGTHLLRRPRTLDYCLVQRWRKLAFQAAPQPSGKWILIKELRACSNLRRGKAIHAQAIQGGSVSCIYLATALVKMYAKCGSMAEARQVFDATKHPDVVLWTALILGYADTGEGITALELFSEMKSQGCVPDSFTFSAALKACTSLARAECLWRGTEIHSQIGCHSDIYVQAALIQMYAKCGSMASARQVFDSMKQPNLVSWTALISGYAENGEAATALDMFASTGYRLTPDYVTFVAALKACASLALQQECDRADCLKRARQIHSQIGCHSHIKLNNTLIDMYAKCGSMSDARQVFDCLKSPDVVSWNALIQGYADNGENNTAMDLFERMKSQGCAPDSVTFVAALKACGSLALQEGENRQGECLRRGCSIHSQIERHLDMYVQTALIDMYAKCGSMAAAHQVFENIKHPNVVSWNALILRYAENGKGVQALDLFERMISQGSEPNSGTFIAALKACIALKQDGWESADCLRRGKVIHLRIGLGIDLNVQSTLIDMYSKCESMPDARLVFDSFQNPDVASWNALLLGYAENGEGLTALDLFAKMRSEGPAPSSISWIAALKACSSLATEQGGCARSESLERGRQIHREVGCYSHIKLQNALIDMYAKCGSMIDARRVFEGIQNPDVVSWTCLILGYAENGEGITSLDLFAAMRSRGFVPDCCTLVAVLRACSSLGALEYGRKLHAAMDSRTEKNMSVLTSLVDFYSKCGNPAEAQKLFDSHKGTRNLRTWNALLAGYSRLGDDKAVFALLKRMQDAGLQPDSVTFLSILTCCSHAGLVKDATDFFERMTKTHGIPTLDHYTCMIDIFGRSNRLDDAMALLRRMPCRADAVTWMTVLGSCHKWKNVWIGRLAFRSLASLSDCSPAAYVLMAQIYGRSGMWEEQEMVLNMR